MNRTHFTGIADDDRRIARELQAMGAFDQPPQQDSAVTETLQSIAQFITWMRWKGEVSVYGCRVAAQRARIEEGQVPA